MRLFAFLILLLMLAIGNASVDPIRTDIESADDWDDDGGGEGDGDGQSEREASSVDTRELGEASMARSYSGEFMGRDVAALAELLRSPSSPPIARDLSATLTGGSRDVVAAAIDDRGGEAGAGRVEASGGRRGPSGGAFARARELGRARSSIEERGVTADDNTDDRFDERRGSVGGVPEADASARDIKPGDMKPALVIKLRSITRGKVWIDGELCPYVTAIADAYLRLPFGEMTATSVPTATVETEGARDALTEETLIRLATANLTVTGSPKPHFLGHGGSSAPSSLSINGAPAPVSPAQLARAWQALDSAIEAGALHLQTCGDSNARGGEEDLAALMGFNGVRSAGTRVMNPYAAALRDATATSTSDCSTPHDVHADGEGAHLDAGRPHVRVIEHGFLTLDADKLRAAEIARENLLREANEACSLTEASGGSLTSAMAAEAAPTCSIVNAEAVLAAVCADCPPAGEVSAEKTAECAKCLEIASESAHASAAGNAIVDMRADVPEDDYEDDDEDPDGEAEDDGDDEDDSTNGQPPRMLVQPVGRRRLLALSSPRADESTTNPFRSRVSVEESQPSDSSVAAATSVPECCPRRSGSEEFRMQSCPAACPATTAASPLSDVLARGHVINRAVVSIDREQPLAAVDAERLRVVLPASGCPMSRSSPANVCFFRMIGDHSDLCHESDDRGVCLAEKESTRGEAEPIAATVRQNRDAVAVSESEPPMTSALSARNTVAAANTDSTSPATAARRPHIRRLRRLSADIWDDHVGSTQRTRLTLRNSRRCGGLSANDVCPNLTAAQPFQCMQMRYMDATDDDFDGILGGRLTRANSNHSPHSNGDRDRRRNAEHYADDTDSDYYYDDGDYEVNGSSLKREKRVVEAPQRRETQMRKPGVASQDFGQSRQAPRQTSALYDNGYATERQAQQRRQASYNGDTRGPLMRSQTQRVPQMNGEMQRIPQQSGRMQPQREWLEQSKPETQGRLQTQPQSPAWGLTRPMPRQMQTRPSMPVSQPMMRQMQPIVSSRQPMYGVAQGQSQDQWRDARQAPRGVQRQVIPQFERQVVTRQVVQRQMTPVSQSQDQSQWPSERRVERQWVSQTRPSSVQWQRERATDMKKHYSDENSIPDRRRDARYNDYSVDDYAYSDVNGDRSRHPSNDRYRDTYADEYDNRSFDTRDYRSNGNGDGYYSDEVGSRNRLDDADEDMRRSR